MRDVRYRFDPIRPPLVTQFYRFTPPRATTCRDVRSHRSRTKPAPPLARVASDTVDLSARDTRQTPDLRLRLGRSEARRAEVRSIPRGAGILSDDNGPDCPTARLPRFAGVGPKSPAATLCRGPAERRTTAKTGRGRRRSSGRTKPCSPRLPPTVRARCPDRWRGQCPRLPRWEVSGIAVSSGSGRTHESRPRASRPPTVPGPGGRGSRSGCRWLSRRRAGTVDTPPRDSPRR